MSWRQTLFGCLFIWLLSSSAYAAVSIDDLLQGVNDNLSVNLQTTGDYLEVLDGRVDEMEIQALTRYVLLKASYLGLTGQHRQRIALARKFQGEFNSADTQVKLLYELSDAYTRLGENEDALKAMNRGIRLLPKLTENNAKVSILQGAITLLSSLDAFDDAMNYADRIYRMGVSSNDSNYICLGLANKLDIQFKQGRGDNARVALARTLQICNDSDYHFVSNILLGSNAISLIDGEQYQQGVEQALKVLNNYVQNNNQSAQISRLEEALSRGYFHLGQYSEAEQYAQKSLQLAKALDSSFLLKNVHLNLAKIKQARGDEQGALFHYEQFADQSRRFEQDKVARNLAFQRVKYDNLDKTNQLQLLKVKNNSLQLTQKLQARNNENLLLILALAAVMLLFMTILLVLSFRKKHALVYDAGQDVQAQTSHFGEAGLSQLALNDARQKGVQFCVILFEVDCLAGFDTLLEEETAATLVNEVSMLCEEQLRQSDHFGRISEHQFVICLLESTVRGAAALAERCRQAISTIDIESNVKLPMGSTFGVAMIDDHFVDYNEALGAAEKALQQAKQRGGDQVYVHHLLEEYDEL